MTIASQVSSQQLPCNGVATQLSFPNKIFSPTDLVVTLIDTLGNLYSFSNGGSGNVFSNVATGLSYTVFNIDVDGGCYIVFSLAPTNGWTCDMRTVTPELQSTSVKNQGNFLPELHEEFFDRATRMLQDLYRQTYTYGIHGPDIESTPWPSLPIASARKGQSLMFDAVQGLPTLGVPSAVTLTGQQLALYGTDSGLVNAYVFTHAGPVAATLTAGTLIRLTVLNTNTGASTINVDGTGAVAVLGEGGSAVTGGELNSLGPVLLQYTGAAWQVVATAGAQPGFNRQPAETAAGVIPPSAGYAFLPGAAARYGAKGDGVTDDSVAFANAALVSGTYPIQLLHTTYIVNTPFVLPQGGSIFTDSRASTLQTNIPGNHIVSAVGVSNITLYSITLKGAGSQTHPAFSIGGVQNIATGLATFVNCTNVRVYDCEASGFANGISCVQCSKCFVTHNFIHNWMIYGILGSGSTEASFDFNVMDTCDLQAIPNFTAAPALNATSATLAVPWPYPTGTYGVSFVETSSGQIEIRAVTLTNGATTATWTTGLAAACNALCNGNAYGISATGNEAAGSPAKGVSISFNRIWNVPTWDAIMSHDGAGYTIIGNDCRNVRAGIDLSLFANTFDRNCTVMGNYVEATTQDYWNGQSALSTGIQLFGATSGITFTGAPAGGATSATLNAAWTSETNVYTVQFTETAGGLFELRQVTLTNGATTATWSQALSANCNAAASVVFTVDTATVTANMLRNFGNMVEVNQSFSISGISQASSAVVTINRVSTANPISVGSSVYISGVVGMTQINGLTAIVSAIGGVSGAWTFTIPVTSTSFTAYSSGGTVYSNGFAISGISQAASAVVTINSQNTSNPIANGSTLYFANVGGMTQINGLTGTVTAVGGAAGAWTATVNINSGAFGAYTSGGTATQGAPTISNAGVIILEYVNDGTCTGNIIESCGTIANFQNFVGIYMVGVIVNGVVLGNVVSSNLASGAIRSVALTANNLVIDGNIINQANSANIAIQLGNTTQIGYGGGGAGGLSLGSNPTNSATPFFGAGTIILAQNCQALKGTQALAAVATQAVTFPNGLQTPNTTYQVGLSQNAISPAGSLSPPWITAKSKTGFTINFGAAFTGNVDWQVGI